MNPNKHLRAIQKSMNAYRSTLNKMNEDLFSKTPLSGGWSFSEVYSHIFDSSLLSLRAIQACVKGEGKSATTPFAAKAILFFGRFPPGRYKVPKRLAERVKKITIPEAEQLIRDFEAQLNTIEKTTSQALPRVKIAHPRLGYLNAMQWLRFIDIHMCHHLKQLKRIEKDHQKPNKPTN